MGELMKKAWNEYFPQECNSIDTEEEKLILRKMIKLQNITKELLTKEQCS